jgi:hypothetical protein
MPAITKVFEENTFSGAYGPDELDGTGTVTVEHDAYIFASGDNGIEFAGGPWKVKVDGYVQSNLNGMAFYDPTTVVGNSSIAVGTEGTIVNTGAGFSGISTGMALDVVNSGLIQGTDNGIKYAGIFHSTTKSISVTNNAGGEIRGSDYGIYLDDYNHNLVLKNAGIIDEVWWGGGSTIINSGTIEELYEYSGVDAYNNTLTNTGTIHQGFGGGHGADVVTNSGTIGGGLSLNNGNNTVTNKGTIDHIGIDGSIYAAEGNDTLTNTGTIDSFIKLGAGTNKVTNGGTIGGYLELGAGNDTVGNTGSIGGYVHLLEGTNTLTNGGTITGEVTGGAGNDTLTNSGSIADLVNLGGGNNKVTNSGSLNYMDLGTGNDTVTNTKTISSFVEFDAGTNTLANSGTIGGDLYFGSGDDKVTNTGILATTVLFADGKNTLTNGGSIGGNVTFGKGDDTLTNTKGIGGAVDMGGGDNKLTNGGTIGGSITFGTGDDTFTNTKSIGNVDLGDGDNTVTNSGTISSIWTGSGDDIIKNTGHISNVADFGAGDDKFTGGNFADFLQDGAGNDTYALGGGDDAVLWAANGNDTIDGAAGFDSFDTGTFMTAATSINLDSKAVTVLGHNLAASSAVAGASVATLKNFEAVYGGSLIDVIAGSAGNDTLQGNQGNDILYGGKGADRLSGTQDSDIYVYLQPTDSGNTKATRDLIEDFEGAHTGGGDVIDLSAIDANTKTAAINDDFHLIASIANAQFDATPGGIRWVHDLAASLTIIQGDVNGDLKADFSIAVNGIVDFVSGDFSGVLP